MTTTRQTALLSAIDQPAAVDWLRRAVQLPSVTGEEVAFAALVAAELRACGADEIHQRDVSPGRPLLWSVTRGRGEGPSVLVAGHLDTVPPSPPPPEWLGTDRANPFAAAVVDGALWGRGAADTKGGIATTLAAHHALQRAGTPPAGDLVTLWVPDEESGVPGLGRSVGMRAAAELIAAGIIPRPDFALYLEPTRLAVFTAQIGFVIAAIAVEGRTAYFGRPEDGVDALRAAYPVLSELWCLHARLRTRTPHPLLGTPRLLVTSVQAGGLVAVPGSCDIRLIRSVIPAEDLAEVAHEIRAAVHSATRASPATATVSFPDGRDHEVGGLPAETDPDAPPVRALRAAVAAVAPDSAATGAAPYWSEISFLTALGIPAVYWGPGDITHCHTHREHLDLAEFDTAVAALSCFLAGEPPAAGEPSPSP